MKFLKLKVLEEKKWFLFSSFLFLAIVSYLPSFFIPFVHGDEGGWLYQARYAFNGGLYLDVSDNKPPFFIQLYALSSSDNLIFFRLIVLVWSVFGAVFLYKILRQFFDQSSSFLATSLFALSIGLIEAGCLSCERLLLPFLVLGTLLAFRVKEKINNAFSPCYSFLAGLCFGAAINIKQTAFVLGAFIFWVLLFSKNRFRNILFALLGAIFFTWVSWWKTGVDAALIYRETYQQNFSYISHGGALIDVLKNAAYSLALFSSLIFASLCGLIFFIRERKGRLSWESLSFALLLALSLLSISIGFRFYQTYYILLLPVLCVGAAFAFSKLIGQKKLYVCFALMIACVGARHTITVVRQVTQKNQSWNVWVEKLVQDVHHYTESEDYIWISHAVQPVYAVTGRRAATKYIYFHQTLGHIDICQTSEDQLNEGLANENYEHLLRDLYQNKPKLIFWTQSKRNTCTDRLKKESFPRINEFIESGYTLKYVTPLGDLYLRN